MIDWLTDTLVMTGALMALVLLIRRPVGRWFGPKAAYALWLLPMLRLVMPPLAVPLALAPSALVERMVPVAEPVVSAPVQSLVTQPAAELTTVSQPVAMSLPIEQASTVLPQIEWNVLLLAIWLGGALAFLGWRTWNYQSMRRQILADARQVAVAGRIRIVESPLAAAPLAFGVFDKFVALPLGFLAEVDSESSDFAIAHELEHHAGGDLLALIVLQPLFALHWFNPLGWAAWRALRSDQEVACDARVMNGRAREEKARYGALIAGFAGGSRLTLAAPMAGGISGSKPIVERLRALTRSEVSPQRKAAAHGLFALAIIGVPLTATASYAAIEGRARIATAERAPAKAALAEPPAPPEQPAAMHAVPEAPAMPEAPVAPDAPPSPPAPHFAMEPAEPPVPPVPPVPPQPPVPPRAPDYLSAETQKQVDEAERLAARAMAMAPRVEHSRSADGKVEMIRIVQKDKRGRAMLKQEMVLDSSCPADSNARGNSGVRQTICTGAPTNTMKVALEALSHARAAIAESAGMSAEIRAQALREVDRELENAHREMREGV